jgi:thymidylate kinase
VRLIAVSGVDGSGKSTFVRQLVPVLRSEHGLEVQPLWLRFNPRASFGSAPATSVSTLDSRHRGHLLKRTALRLGLRGLWVRAVVAMYRRQLHLQLSAAQSADVVIADRYVLDFCADLARSGLVGPQDCVRMAEAFPMADVTLVLTGTPQVLLGRRDPHEDPRAILQQRELYQELADRFGAAILDTSEPDALGSVLDSLRGRGIL